MNYTTAQIITKYLIGEGIIESPTKLAIWPGYISHLPGGKSVQQAVALSDTQGVNNGRIMKTGEVIEHPGLQIRVRSRDFETSFKKATEAADKLSTTIRETVTMNDGSKYLINNVSRFSSILPMGVEPETRLFLCSVNFTATITEI